MLEDIHQPRLIPNARGVLQLRTLVETRILPFLHDSNYYYRLFWAVCNHRIDQLDPELQNSLVLFREAFGNVFYDNANMSSILNRLANQSVQNYNENLAKNLQSIVCRMVELEIKVMMHVDLTSDYLKKLSKHVCKRLCRVATVWPHSVPDIPLHRNTCRIVFEKFKICFLHLCPENQRHQFTFENDADPNTGFHGYPNEIRAEPQQFLGIFFQASRYIEHIKNRIEQGTFEAVEHPMTSVILPYCLQKFRTKLDWGIAGRPFPEKYQGKLFTKIKMLIDELKEIDGLENVNFRALDQNPALIDLDQNDMEILIQADRRIFEVMDYTLNRPDTFNLQPNDQNDRPRILSDNDRAYLYRFIFKTSVKIRRGEFTPKLRLTVGNTKMFHIVPQRSFTRSHIPIDRVTFHSLLFNSGFRNLDLGDLQLPAWRVFEENDELAARWYWRIFNFPHTRFKTFAQFYPGRAPQNKRFEFLIDTDGTAFSAHYSKPLFMDEAAGRSIQQILHDLRGRITVFTADPGQSNCMTVMEGTPIVHLNNEPPPDEPVNVT